MKTFPGIAVTALAAFAAGAFSGCAPAVVASYPHPVYHAPAPDPVPVQTVIVPPAPVVPVVPVWAPPYAYVTQVHYYYFPDYMVYYDVFASNYCYFDGYNWLHVAVLPAIPMYYGFSPYTSYLVVLNRNTYDPWNNYSYYQQQYPAGYYQSTYAPRTTLSSNTVLRAFDENESRPVFVDKRSNKEVKVQYDVHPRSSASTNTGNRNSQPASDVRPAQRSDIRSNVQNNGRSRTEENAQAPVFQDSRSQRSSTPVAPARGNQGRSEPVNTPSGRQAPSETPGYRGREDGRAVVQSHDPATVASPDRSVFRTNENRRPVMNSGDVRANNGNVSRSETPAAAREASVDRSQPRNNEKAGGRSNEKQSTNAADKSRQGRSR